MQGGMDAATEIFTAHGWTAAHALRPGDRVGVLGQRGHLELHPLTRVHVRNHMGHLYSFHGKRIDFALARGHRLLVGSHNCRGSKVRLEPVHALPVARFLLPKVCQPAPGRAATFVLPARRLAGEGVRRDRHAPLGPTSREAFARVLGLWLAEGTRIRSQEAGSRVDICQVKPEGVAFIDAAFDALGWPYLRRIYGNEVRWTLHSWELRAFLFSLQQGPSRRMPADALQWAQAERQALMEGLLEGDGTHSTQAGRITLLTGSDPLLLGDFQRLQLVSGGAGNVRTSLEAGPRAVFGGVHAGKASYRCHVDLRPDANLWRRDVVIEPYAGRLTTLMTAQDLPIKARRHGVHVYIGGC